MYLLNGLISWEGGGVTQILMISIYCLLISWEELSLNDILLVCDLSALENRFFLLWYIGLGLLRKGRGRRLLQVEGKKQTE